MFNTRIKKSFLWAPLLAATLFAGAGNSDAAQRRVAFDPDYGAPFALLGWRGEAIVDYGTCDGPGQVTNLPGSCNGELSFTAATVELYNNADPLKPTLQTLNFTGGQVAWLSFDGAKELTSVVSSPFNPIQGNIPEADYAGSPAYFSLIFVGDYAQLYWFQNNPGNALVDPLAFPYVQLPNALTYAGCYLAGPGDHGVGKNRCGLSSNLDGAGAKLTITAVPEPGTYALMLAGLFSLVVMARRRSAREH